MSLFYRVLYSIGLKPWEQLPTSSAAGQVATMFDREEEGREPPFGRALDLGCGSGIWAVELAKRGWDVTGVDVVPKAIRQAQARAEAAGVRVQFLDAPVSALDEAQVAAGYRLVLDFGTVHGLSPADVKATADGITGVAADDATLLMYASSPGRRGPLPRGLTRDEIEAAYTDWRIVEEQPFDSDIPTAFKKTEPRWLRLRRR